MAEVEQFRAHVHIMGSSTAKGYGGKPGFDQILMKLYEGENSYNWRPDPVESCRFLLVHREGEPGMYPPLLARQFRRRIGLGLEVAGDMALPSRSLGIFVVSNVLSSKTVEHMGGPLNLRTSWESAFNALALECEDLGVKPVVFTTPTPTPEMTFASGPPDPELFASLTDATTVGATAMNADLVTFEDIVGNDKSGCLAPDLRHPNPRGHVLIAEYMAGLIGDHFDIPSDRIYFPV